MPDTYTLRLHRVLTAPPERVYKAFLDVGAMCKWLPPYGFTAKFPKFEGRVGGEFQGTFTNFSNGQSHSFTGKYLELELGKRLKYTDKLDMPGASGEMTVTVVLKKVSVGTDMQIEQAGVPSAIPEEACQVGWHQSLLQLAQLVEPEIPAE